MTERKPAEILEKISRRIEGFDDIPCGGVLMGVLRTEKVDSVRDGTRLLGEHSDGTRPDGPRPGFARFKNQGKIP